MELSTVSEALLQLRKPYTMIRYYVPASFRDELRFKGPERFPPDSLDPGST